MAKIVYVDDESYLTEIFEGLFANTDHQLTVFNDEYPAIQHCLADPPDILFVDYRLEKLHGDELARQVPNQTVKVLVTGDISIHTEFRFDEILAKPFKLNEVLATVDKFARTG